MDIIRLSWMLICMMVGTLMGGVLGWLDFGWSGAVGMGLIGLIVGIGFGATPSLLMEALK